jgi:CRP/FNR family transcriptional regulator
MTISSGREIADLLPRREPEASASDSRSVSQDGTIAERLILLQGLPYMAGLAAPVLRAIAEGSTMHTHRAGEVLVVQGDPCPGLLVVQSGRLKTSLLSPAGREHILDIFGPGEAVNEADAFNGTPGVTTIEAMDDTTTLLVGCHSLTLWQAQLTPTARSALQVLARRCLRLVDVVADLSLRPVSARLAGLLLDHALRPDRPTLTRGQMAARLGTVREMISRSLRDLERTGLIRIEHGQIVIVQRDELARLAER